jgi:gamma-glutamylcyclotransferase
MSLRRIKNRVPSATVIGTGQLSGHELKFHKISKKDGSAKCDIFQNDDPDSKVIGIVFEIDEKGKKTLDKKEGLSFGYEQKNVKIVTSEGSKISVFTYYATNTDNNIKPYTWYKEHVLRGAKENNLPEQYITKLEKVVAIEDPDRERHEKEMQIYR